LNPTALALCLVGENVHVSAHRASQAGNVVNIDSEPTAVPGRFDLAFIALVPHGGNWARARRTQQRARALQLASF
jgi:hypothetical protein